MKKHMKKWVIVHSHSPVSKDLDIWIFKSKKDCEKEFKICIEGIGEEVECKMGKFWITI